MIIAAFPRNTVRTLEALALLCLLFQTSWKDVRESTTSRNRYCSRCHPDDTGPFTTFHRHTSARCVYLFRLLEVGFAERLISSTCSLTPILQNHDPIFYYDIKSGIINPPIFLLNLAYRGLPCVCNILLAQS